MMRLIVLAAPEVCSVPNTRWPVSAASMAAWIVSRSRISPTRMMSGSIRSARRMPSLKSGHVDADLALVDRALLVLVVVLDRVFQRDDVPVVVVVDEVDHADARLVVLPEPVGPVTSSRPRGRMISDRIASGHADLLERQELARDPPQHHADGAALLEDGDAEAVRRRCTRWRSRPRPSPAAPAGSGRA